MTVIHLHWHDTCHISAKAYPHAETKPFAVLTLELDQTTTVKLFGDSLSQLSALLNIAQIQLKNAMESPSASGGSDAPR